MKLVTTLDLFRINTTNAQTPVFLMSYARALFLKIPIYSFILCITNCTVAGEIRAIEHRRGAAFMDVNAQCHRVERVQFALDVLAGPAGQVPPLGLSNFVTYVNLIRDSQDAQGRYTELRDAIISARDRNLVTQEE